MPVIAIDRGQAAATHRWRLLLLLLSAVVVITVLHLTAVAVDEGSPEAGFARPAPPAVDAVIGTATVTETAAAPAPPAIVLRDGRLSVALEGVPLRQVTAELSRLSGIDIRFLGQHRPTILNQRFEDYPLEQGLRALLRGTDSVFVYTEAGGLSRILLLADAASGDEKMAAAADAMAVPIAIPDDPIARQTKGVGVQVMEQLRQAGIPDFVNESSPAPHVAVQAGERLATRVRRQLAGTGLVRELASDEDFSDPNH